MDEFVKIAIGAGVGGAFSGFGIFMAMRIAIAEIKTDIEWIKSALND